MNDEIRATLRAELARQGKSMSELARELAISRNQISRMLSAKRKHSAGELSSSWQKLLDSLDFELRISKKDSSHGEKD